MITPRPFGRLADLAIPPRRPGVPGYRESRR